MADILNFRNPPAEWPFPVKYGEENRIETDVLIIGGGIAGAMAGIMAARRGVKAAIVDKAPIGVSGSGGAGIDHYNGCVSNPDCPYTPEEFMEFSPEAPLSAGSGDHRLYMSMKGAWEALLEMEKLGLKFRDENDEFAGAPFRNEETKVLYAYDYETRSSIRLCGGADFKKHLQNGLLQEENATLFERVMITSLLTEGGKQNARPVGATGVNVETGAFYVFSAKSVILCTAGVSMQGTSTWTFNQEMFSNGYRSDPNNTGEGVAMAWKAGAEFHGESEFGQALYTGPFGWPWYGIGNPSNTWHPCTIVDNKGAAFPFVDVHGQPIATVEERTLPPKDGPFSKLINPTPTPYIDPAKIESGEYELPLWADLSSMSAYERRGIWGLMVGNEGRTRTAIYNYYNKAGFNPDKDMLQVPNMTPENFGRHRKDWFQGEPLACRTWKADTLQGIATDWNSMTSIEGLYAAGAESGQSGSIGIVAGTHAGNRAAEYAMKTERGSIDKTQLAAEKERVYAPVKRMNDPEARISWKELWMGMTRVMQQDCSDFRTPTTCAHGLMWLDSIKRLEMQLTYARNPHELVRVLECESRMTVAEVYLYSALADFKAAEEGVDPNLLMYNKLIDGELITKYKEDKWWLKPPYAPTYLENYEKSRAFEKEVK